MTEAEWLAGYQPEELFAEVREPCGSDPRVLRLFAAAFWSWQADRLKPGRVAEELSEQVTRFEEWAETGIPPEGVERDQNAHVLSNLDARVAAHETVVFAWRWASSKEAQSFACALVREVFGNPFRPVAFAPEWRTATAVALAAQIYKSRDFGAMPILADALQDAGCDHGHVLDHCRGDGPHARGCWVVDLVLGKR